MPPSEPPKPAVAPEPATPAPPPLLLLSERHAFIDAIANTPTPTRPNDSSFIARSSKQKDGEPDARHAGHALARSGATILRRICGGG
jgi:hypothetical protein